MYDEVLKPTIQNLINGIRALRGFVASVEPAVLECGGSAEEMRYTMALALEYIISRVDPDTRNAIAVPPELLGLEGKDINIELVGQNSEDGTKELAFAVSGADAGEFDKAVQLVVASKRLRHWHSLINKVQSDQMQMRILYRSALISLVSQTQVYLSSLFETQFRLRPESLDGETLTIAELNACDTLSDAHDLVLSRRVEDMLHGGLEDWRDEIAKTLGCNLSSYADRFDDALTEIYQRRNLLVHADGVVNAVYLSKVDVAERVGVNKGDCLDVDRAYLDRAIDVFELSFLLLALGFWKRVAADDSSRSTYALELEYDYLLERRWLLVEAIASFTANDPALVSELTNRVNYWLALKRQNRFDEVEAEIVDAERDFNTRRPIFRLVRYALLENHAEVRALLPAALADRGFDLVELAEWPVLDEFRSSPEYIEFVASERDAMVRAIGPEQVASILGDVEEAGREQDATQTNG